MLTTITPYWGRPQILTLWLKALHAAFHSDVEHLVLVIGEPLPDIDPTPNIRFVGVQVKPDKERPSIGYYHNMGATLANSEWIMKLDVDAIPNVEYFTRLLAVIKKAKEREWFNGGMFYANKTASSAYLTQILQPALYAKAVRDVTSYAPVAYRRPCASNFICRKSDYLGLGGCDPRFRGWGWEDYQQLYMLERNQRGEDPLEGPIDAQNVTRRCRDEISRPKAKELFERDNLLGLIHHWHPECRDSAYKNNEASTANRQVLLDYILNERAPK